MKSTRLLVLCTVLVLALLASLGALAMDSLNYQLDWFVPLAGSGGGPSSSSSYAANITIGQAVVGAASSASYQAGLGYWHGIETPYRLFLPSVQNSD